MKHKLKIFGLPLVVLVALFAVVASTASAASPVTSEKITAASYSTSFHGETGVGVQTLTTEAGSVECQSTFSGTMSAASTTLTITPVYTGCKAFGFLSASVSMEGCQFVFHLTTTVTASQYQAHTDLICSAGKSVKIVASTCKAEMNAQSTLTTSDFLSAGSEIRVRPTLSKIAYTVTEDGFLCPFGGTGNKADGTYSSSISTLLKGSSKLDIG